MAIFTFDADHQLIKSDDKSVRVLLVGEEKRDPWFRGNDVADLLGYSKRTRAVVTHVSTHRKSTLAELMDQGRPITFGNGHIVDTNERSAWYIDKEGFLMFTAKSSSRSVTSLREWVLADGVTSHQTRPNKRRKLDVVAENESASADEVFAVGQCIENLWCDGIRYYKGNDIARVLGYQDPKKAVQLHVPLDYVATGRDIGVTGNRNAMGTRFVTKEGVSYLVYNSRLPNSLAIAKDLGIPLSTRFKAYTHELNTITALMKAFQGERMIYQHRVGAYRLDLFFPDYKLVVECDEKNHRAYDKNKEEERQQWITSKLDASWVRFNPDDRDFDIFLVISEIHKHMMQIRR
jgi:prophage antirepressor-like protein/very-short-patch-repair endonuclease